MLGVEDPYSFISFEDEVMVDKTNFMDGYIASTRVLIEQKSIQKDLGTPIVQSNGEKITPFLRRLPVRRAWRILTFAPCSCSSAANH